MKSGRKSKWDPEEAFEIGGRCASRKSYLRSPHNETLVESGRELRGRRVGSQEHCLGPDADPRTGADSIKGEKGLIHGKKKVTVDFRESHKDSSGLGRT